VGDVASHDQPGTSRIPPVPQRGVTRLHLHTDIAQPCQTRRGRALPLRRSVQGVYDRVHFPSLWFLLRAMGVPELIVSLLDDWASKRRTQLRVNGTLSDWYPMLAGTPQGDQLSCLLFNLYIEPLIRYIKSNVTIRGVSIPGGDRFLKEFSLRTTSMACLVYTLTAHRPLWMQSCSGAEIRDARLELAKTRPRRSPLVLKPQLSPTQQ
jgi:hypothetical protein